MKFTIHNRNLLTIPAFLLYPLYSLPLIIRSMLVGEKFGLIMFSLFMGILGYLFIPYETMDLTRYYADFNTINSLSLLEVIAKGGSHLFINIFMWLVNFLGLPKETVSLVFVALSYYLHMVVLLYVLHDYQPALNTLSKKLFLLIFIFILLNEIKFIGATSGLRNELAFSISILSVYLIFTKKENIKGTILLLLSALIHSSTFVLIPLIFISKLKVFHKAYRILFLLSLAILILGASEFIFYFLIDFMKPYLVAMDMWHPLYFSRDGKWGGGFWASFNFKTFVLEKYIKPMPFYMAGIYLFVVTKTTAPDYRRFLYLLFFMVAIVSMSRTLFDRYNYLTVLLFITMLMIEYRLQTLTKFKKIFITLFILSLLIVDAANIYKYRDTWLPSWSKILYLPLPVLLLERVEPEKYIIRHENDKN